MSWELKSFDELGFIGRGKSRHRPRNDESLYGGDFPLIQTGDVKNANLYITEYSQTYSQKGLEQSKLWQPNTLCITIAANIADTTILGIQACFPDSIIGFVADEKVCDVRFIKYHFDIVQKQMQMVSQGATQDNLSLEKLLKFKVPTPPLQTQKRIASILSNYDDLIENNFKRIKLLEETAQNIYKEWFVNFRFPNYENTPLNEETGLPIGWEMKNFEEIANFSQGLQVSTELQFEDKRDDRTRFIRIVDVTQGNQPYRYIETPDSKYVIEKDDIFMVRYGAPQVVIGYEGVIANNFFKISINDKIELLNNFLFMFLKQDNINQTLMALSSSATMPAISFKRIANIQILVPSINLQTIFSNQYSNILNYKYSLEYQNQKLKEARDILLPRLMNRTIEV